MQQKDLRSIFIYIYIYSCTLVCAHAYPPYKSIHMFCIYVYRYVCRFNIKFYIFPVRHKIYKKKVDSVFTYDTFKKESSRPTTHDQEKSIIIKRICWGYKISCRKLIQRIPITIINVLQIRRQNKNERERSSSFLLELIFIYFKGGW